MLKVLKYCDLPGDEFEYAEVRQIMTRSQVRQVVKARVLWCYLWGGSGRD